MTNQPLSREIKTAAMATSAQLTVVSRDHPTAGNSTSSYSTSTKTKAKAVVTPFSRSQGGGKKVNINTVVSQFYIKSQTEKQDEPKVLYLFGGSFCTTQWLSASLIHLFAILKNSMSSENIRKYYSFLMFSGGIGIQFWDQMG